MFTLRLLSADQSSVYQTQITQKNGSGEFTAGSELAACIILKTRVYRSGKARRSFSVNGWLHETLLN